MADIDYTIPDGLARIARGLQSGWADPANANMDKLQALMTAFRALAVVGKADATYGGLPQTDIRAFHTGTKTWADAWDDALASVATGGAIRVPAEIGQQNVDRRLDLPGGKFVMADGRGHGLGHHPFTNSRGPIFNYTGAAAASVVRLNGQGAGVVGLGIKANGITTAAIDSASAEVFAQDCAILGGSAYGIDFGAWGQCGVFGCNIDMPGGSTGTAYRSGTDAMSGGPMWIKGGAVAWETAGGGGKHVGPFHVIGNYPDTNTMLKMTGSDNFVLGIYTDTAELEQVWFAADHCKVIGIRGRNSPFAMKQGAGNMTSGSAVLTRTSGSTFAAGDVGKSIVVVGAGAGGGTLNTTISVFTDANTVTLGANAGATLTGGKFATPAIAFAKVDNCIGCEMSGFSAEIGGGGRVYGWASILSFLGTGADFKLGAGELDAIAPVLNSADRYKVIGSPAEWGLSTSASAYVGRRVSLYDEATVSVDLAQGDSFELAAGGSRTIANPTNAVDGKVYAIAIKNNTGGAITTTWGANYKRGGAWTDPAAGKTRTIFFYASGNNLIEVGRVGGDI